MTEVVNVLNSIIDLIWDLFSSIINFIIEIPSYIQFIYSSLFVLPNQIIPFATASVAIFVVLLIAGRQSN